MAKIAEIKPGTAAAKAGLEPGDFILTVNDKPLRDYIDYRYQTAEQKFTLLVAKKNGEQRKVEIERNYGEEVGITFDEIIFDRLKVCNNNCIFCFVTQQPPDMRDTLCIRDDDYRFSFLQGSFITLTNLSEEEFERIISLNLSPLNISVHTTNQGLRKEMMGNPGAGEILSHLDRLAANGISFNTQVVLCPSINDGSELDRTIQDLKKYYPGIISLGIVPVGLTRYRDNKRLKSYNSSGAKKVLEQISVWQERLKRDCGENWLYAADEFYLLAGREIPAYEHYGDFPQIENGVGLTRLFWRELEKLESEFPGQVTENRKFTVVTGELGARALKPVIVNFNRIRGINMEMLPVGNEFFGREVTVTGLLTGRDIVDKLKETGHSGEIILPGVALNDDGLFLDDLGVEDIAEEINPAQIHVCRGIADILEVAADE